MNVENSFFDDRVMAEVSEMLKSVCVNSQEIFLVSLCTADGFNIRSFASETLSVEADKVSAIASTIGSLSDSASRQIMLVESQTTTIETANGNILFLSCMLVGKPCVLTLAAKSSMQLANARFAVMRLAQALAKIA
ncbi:roadblock/LC7 domain-containing protein [Arenicella xantha]|uniref:Putative regulator of Ras-like GTPase activity (Roadblock/LC7/MglB family) n=1 Tax=Arenicella xantha TaxID=644221 RepID=A0A395JK67_9GAMM|nr:hypothetical protein [Arenicella xantha]RBP51166.1 putative regulator of Ras-like GTPase activity (Roadblock/LC7/MglB family) [Arenicella xantha]